MSQLINFPPPVARSGDILSTVKKCNEKTFFICRQKCAGDRWNEKRKKVAKEH
jgi:hypothetical protein